ncbi:unnamed protein product, partial [Staurois parvus]
MMSEVTTDWPISDHMIGTSHRGPVQRSVFRITDRLKWRAPFMNGNLLLHCSHPSVYIHGPDEKWL